MKFEILQSPGLFRKLHTCRTCLGERDWKRTLGRTMRRRAFVLSAGSL